MSVTMLPDKNWHTSTALVSLYDDKLNNVITIFLLCHIIKLSIRSCNRHIIGELVSNDRDIKTVMLQFSLVFHVDKYQQIRN